jgi:hypothetical protein
MMRRYAKCELDDKQSAAVREQCDATGTQLVALDAPARKERLVQLSQTIEEKVLTPEQKAKLAAKPERKAAKAQTQPTEE